MRAGTEEMSWSENGKWETWKRRGVKRTGDEMVNMRKSESFLNGGSGGRKRGKRGQEMERTPQNKIKAKEKPFSLIEK